MGTLLATILSISMMTGCGHTAKINTDTVDVRTAPLKGPAAVEAPTAAPPALEEPVVTPQPTRQDPKPSELRLPRRSRSERWIPEKVAPQQYFNTGGLAPQSLMGWRR